MIKFKGKSKTGEEVEGFNLVNTSGFDNKNPHPSVKDKVFIIDCPLVGYEENIVYSDSEAVMTFKRKNHLFGTLIEIEPETLQIIHHADLHS